MSTNAASESVLGELHAKVATVMGRALDQVETAQKVYDVAASAVIADPDSLVDLVMPERPNVNSSLLSVITKFLSDNSITAEPEKGSLTGQLAEKLERNRKNRRVAGGGTVLDFPTHSDE